MKDENKNEENNLDEKKEGNNNISADSEITLEEEGEYGTDPTRKLKLKLKVCEEERQENLLGWQRARADYSNALVRFKEENSQAKNFGLSMALEAMLPALESLNRAKEAGAIPKSFEGIAKQIQSAFNSLGASEIKVEIGEKFNPSEHEALGKDQVTEMEKDDTVTAILDSGWKIGERVVKPARVRVGHFDKK